MEKIWIRHFGLCAASALGLLLGAGSLEAQDQPDTKSVVVDIQTRVEGENIAAARQTAQKLAFEKAVDGVLPSTMTPEKRTEALTKASHWIKGFRVVDEKVEGNILKVQYRCEVSVMVEAEPAPTTSAELTKATFEVAWLPSEVQFNTVDLLKFVNDVMQTPTSSVRMGRGNIVLTLSLKKSLEETQTQLATFVGRRGMVKIIHRDENRPPDALPSAFQPVMPTPEGISTNALGTNSVAPLPMTPTPLVSDRPPPQPLPSPQPKLSEPSPIPIVTSRPALTEEGIPPPLIGPMPTVEAMPPSR